MSTRKLNALEHTLHHAALVKPDKVITVHELESLAPTPRARLAAVNFLLGTGLLTVLQGEKGKITSYQTLVLDGFRASGNEGIWTKHIKAQTQLHQTVVDRCLKSLTQKQLVKTVTDVRYPTRKIYIITNLQPALELTGGPWYTDKELDTEFIKLLPDICLKLVQERGNDSRRRRLYPLSHTAYTFLQKSRVTETVLTVEHVEMLLNVLVLDDMMLARVAESMHWYIPAFRMSTWNLGDESEDDDDVGPSSRHTSKKRKRSHASRAHNRKRRRDVSDDEEGDRNAPSGSKKPKVHEDSSSGSDSDEDALGPRTPVSHRLRSDVADLQSAQSSGGVVYRAIHEERIPSLGTSQSPCVRCPTFDFCSSGGPVNP
ncbi:RNA polymerase Rpc34 [Cubamyces lactineus]|nr:RNA polymerase Rpc34 [Cubamyces lactineus]